MNAIDELAAGLDHQASAGLSQPVARHAERSLLNVLATAVGASRHPAVDGVVKAARSAAVDEHARVPGRPERLAPHWSAIACGLAAHIDDFDDTHLATVIHPAAASAAALVASASLARPTGAQALAAFALGVEAQLRIGVAVSPAHYDAGWHITGTCGVFGGAVTAGLVLGLDAPRLASALRLAALQTLGHREGFGTHAKAFHPGKAAANGLLAAQLARGISGEAAETMDGDSRLLSVLDPAADTLALTAGLGHDWELLSNTFKPYPCGIVAHPGIDAAVDLADQVPDPDAIVHVRYGCHPLVVELMGRLDPADGLQARFSAAHGVAAGLLHGVVGLEQYRDHVVRSAEAVRLRSLISLEVRSDLPRDAAALVVRLRSGQELRSEVAHARGSLARPLGDGDLESKVRGLVEPMLPGGTRALLEAVDGLAEAPSFDAVLDAACPLAPQAVA